MCWIRNKKRTLLLHLFINCISARSGLWVLSLNDECTFLFLNFLITGLYNSSANCSFCLIADLKPLPLPDLSESEADF